VVKIEIKRIFTVPLAPEDVVVDLGIKGWCRFPYKPTGKYRGCPNSLGPGKSCREPMLDDIAQPPFCFVIAIGEFKKYRDDMKKLHKSWSERQLRNPLYWQGQIRKVLKDYTKQLINDKERLFDEKYLDYTTVPEGFGVNVMETLWRLKYDIPKRPDEEVWKVNLIYRRKQNI